MTNRTNGAVLTAPHDNQATCATTEDVRRFKKRMLAWGNPVEFVNNMYGCHPDDDGSEYFRAVFGK